MVDAVARDVLLESDFASLSMSFFQIIGLAQTIIDCNDMFVETKFMLRANLVNIYSSKANPGEYVRLPSRPIILPTSRILTDF